MKKNTPNRCVLVFARFPENGRVKTRLEGRLNRETVLCLYKYFVEDIVTSLERGGYPLIVFYMPPARGVEMSAWLGPHLTYCPQGGGNIGARMQHAFEQAFNRSTGPLAPIDQAVLIGTDFPDLDLQIIEEGFEALSRNDMVLGPAVDGGYYLIGFNRHSFFKEVFSDISWGTGQVFSETLAKTENTDIGVHLLPAWRDIDTFEELKLFYKKAVQKDLEGLKTVQYLRTILS